MEEFTWKFWGSRLLFHLKMDKSTLLDGRIYRMIRCREIERETDMRFERKDPLKPLLGSLSFHWF